MKATLGVVIALILAACALVPGGSDSATPDGTAAGLRGSWVLTDGTGPDGPIPILNGHRITLVVEGSDAGGRAACNLYGGTLTVDGGAARISALSMTEMACDEPAMSAESAYLAAIGVVSAWERQGDRLTLTGPEVELTYELLPPVPDEEIVGTTWVLDSLIQGDAASSVQGEATLFLAAHGKFIGSTGCREVGGTYVVRGDEIDFAELTADGTCPADLQQQDRHIIDVLEGGFSATVDGSSLTLTDNAGHGLAYRAAPGIE